MSEVLESIGKIQDVFEAWRELGSKMLPNGTELMGRHGQEGDDGVEGGWMHAVFPRLGAVDLVVLEGLLSTPLSGDLRRFYSACGGMVLFGGLFRIYGLPRPRGVLFENGPGPDDIVTLNHELDHCDWKEPGAIAVATNDWDASVYFAGMGETESEIVRVAQATGEVLGRSATIWSLVAEKLYRLDEMFLR